MDLFSLGFGTQRDFLKVRLYSVDTRRICADYVVSSALGIREDMECRKEFKSFAARGTGIIFNNWNMCWNVVGYSRKIVIA